MTTNRSAAKTVSIQAIDDRALDAMISRAHAGIDRAMKILRRPQARVGMVGSPLGRLMVAESDRGIAAVHFAFQSRSDRTLEMLRRKFDLVENEPATRRIGAAINRFFKGDVEAVQRRVDLSLVESDFQLRAMAELRRVPAGAVITYQGLAAAVGQPDGQRAIGNTMATNPVPLFVPCHRVIRSDGTIGNYGGGVDAKLKLLRVEGFAVGRDLRVPARAVLGHAKPRIFCRPDCPSVSRADSTRMLIFADADCARRAGMRPCQTCHPEK